MAKPIRGFPLKEDECNEQKEPWFDGREIFCLGSEFFKNIWARATKGSLRPGSYVAFLPCRIQLNELSSAEIRRLNRLPHFCRTLDWSCRIIRQKCDTDSNVEFLPCRIQFIHYVNVLSMQRMRLVIQDGVTEGRLRSYSLSDKENLAPQKKKSDGAEKRSGKIETLSTW